MDPGGAGGADRRGARLSITAGALLGPVLAELGAPYRLESPDRALVELGGIEVEIVKRVERLFLGRIETAEILVPMRLRGGPGVIRIGHRGRLTRTGLWAKARPADGDLVEMARNLASDPVLVGAMLPLDSKLAEIRVDLTASTARLRLVGLSRVVLAVPPTRRYVTAGPDQVEALGAVVSCLAGYPPVQPGEG